MWVLVTEPRPVQEQRLFLTTLQPLVVFCSLFLFCYVFEVRVYPLTNIHLFHVSCVYVSVVDFSPSKVTALSFCPSVASESPLWYSCELGQPTAFQPHLSLGGPGPPKGADKLACPRP